MALLCNLLKLPVIGQYQGLFEHLYRTPDPDRRNQECIRAIDDDLFIQLVKNHFDPNGESPPDSCEVISRAEGAYNHCVIINYDETDIIVVRVPFRGTQETWTEEDAFNHRNEFLTMKYIARHTKIPIPMLHAYHSGLDNSLGAPYFIMHACYGEPAHDALWYSPDMALERPDGTHHIKGADKPSHSLEIKREAFLEELAGLMADLRKLEFNKMGVLHLEDVPNPPPPTVGHHFVHDRRKGMVKYDSHSSTADYFQAMKDQITAEETPKFSGGTTSENHSLYQAYKRVAMIVCDSFPRSVGKHVTEMGYLTEAETFVLAHPDLDLQNIYVDEDGSIIGIIDWTGVRVVPRWVGWAALPLFLRKDWDSDYDINAESYRYPHTPWKLESYREFYSEYLEAVLDAAQPGTFNDSKYTLKSGATCAAFDMFTWPSQRENAVKRLLKAIPCLDNVNEKDFLLRLGNEERWEAAEGILEFELQRLFFYDS